MREQPFVLCRSTLIRPLEVIVIPMFLIMQRLRLVYGRLILPAIRGRRPDRSDSPRPREA